MLQSGLDNVVGVRIADQAFHLTRNQQLFNDYILGLV